MICTLNLQILHDWQHATGGQTSEPDQPPDKNTGEDPGAATTPPNSRPPPPH